MSDFIIREYEKQDIPGLIEIWENIFGDSREFVSGFFRLLPHMGSGAVALSGGKCVGAAYLLLGQEYISPGAEAIRAGYLYAVAVDPAFRRKGLGEALCKYAVSLGRKQGASILGTLPAEDALYGWYERILGTGHILRRRRELIKSCPGPAFNKLGAEGYYKLREALLSGRPHMRYSLPEIKLQELVCADSGGALLGSEEAAAALCIEGGRAVIKELICPDALIFPAAGALAAWAEVEEAELILPSAEGERGIAADYSALPVETPWNICFD